MRRERIATHNAPRAQGPGDVDFYYNGNKSRGVLIRDVLRDPGMIANGHELVLGGYRSVQLYLNGPTQTHFTISCVNNLTKAELALTVCRRIIPYLLRYAAEPIAKGQTGVQIDDLRLISVIDLEDGIAQVILSS